MSPMDVGAFTFRAADHVVVAATLGGPGGGGAPHDPDDVGRHTPAAVCADDEGHATSVAA